MCPDFGIAGGYWLLLVGVATRLTTRPDVLYVAATVGILLAGDAPTGVVGEGRRDMAVVVGHARQAWLGPSWPYVVMPGGVGWAQPDEFSLAHRRVPFPDEMPELSHTVFGETRRASHWRTGTAP